MKNHRQRRRQKRNDEVAMGLVIEHINDSFLDDDVDGCETAKQAWGSPKAVCTTYTNHDQIPFVDERLEFRKPDSMTMKDLKNDSNEEAC